MSIVILNPLYDVRTKNEGMFVGKLHKDKTRPNVIFLDDPYHVIRPRNSDDLIMLAKDGPSNKKYKIIKSKEYENSVAFSRFEIIYMIKCSAKWNKLWKKVKVKK